MSHGMNATRSLGLLLAAIATTACADAAPSIKKSEPVDEGLLPVKPVSPVPGTPSHDETMAWLLSHAQLHLAAVESFTTPRATAWTKVSQTKWPCVLGEGETIKIQNSGTSYRYYSFFINLSLLVSVEVATSKQDPRATCVNMKGGAGFSVKVDGNVAGQPPTITTGTVDSLCFDSYENAQRAANGLSHLGELCGAKERKDPF